MKRLLLSNDDGIHAPGLAALHDAVRDLGQVDVVAPDAEQSAVGHAITIADPIRARRHEAAAGFSGVAVTGTPADCVKLAVTVLLKDKPDLVLSGINLGPNVGISVIYSGTVSAATEGTIMGIPSLAISLGGYEPPLHWDTAAAVARRVAQKVLSDGLPPDTLLNVNVPNRPLADLRGFAVTRMGQSRFIEIFDRRVNPRGDEYFWLDGKLELLGDTSRTDVVALQEGYVSLTPIGFDLTRHAAIPALETWNLAL
jgi:5'-nucleotidase